MENIKKRIVGIDLMKIIAMLMVTTHHFLNYGKLLDEATLFNCNYYLIWILRAVCYTSVNLFVLASSYFLSTSQIKIKKIIELWLEVLFYSVGIYIVLVLLGSCSFSFIGLAKAILPISFRRYGFFNNYLFMYLMTPIYIIIVKNFTKTQFQKLLVLLTIILTIMPYLTFIDTFNTSYGNGIVWFTYLWLIGSYIHKYYKPTYKPAKYFLIGFGFSFLIFCSKVFLAHVTTQVLGSEVHSTILYGETILFNLLASVFIFLGFVNMNTQNMVSLKITGFLAPLAFSVYLIQEQPEFRNVLWQQLLKPMEHVNDFLLNFIGYWFIVILSIFMGSIVIEYCRRKLIHFINSKIHFIEFIEKMSLRIFNYITQKTAAVFEHI